MTAKSFCPIACLALVASCNVFAEPFSLDKMPTHIPVPLPAHTASQMQAAIEQRSKDVDAGAATAWGTAQADLLISQLRAAGVLPEGVVSAEAAKKDGASAPEDTASEPAAAASEEVSQAEPFPVLLLDLDEERLRYMVGRLYLGLSEKRLHECTLAFRKDSLGVMRDALLTFSGAYSLVHGSTVDWESLSVNIAKVLDGHQAKLTSMFVDALKAAARANQTTED